jgi:antagonist of KipI
MTLEVVDGGLAATIQDRGRPDWAHLGVPASGACDPWSLAVANLLAGSARGAAAIEMTIVGPTLVARRAMVIGLAGADLGGRVVGGRRLTPGRSHRIEAGETIAFPGDEAERGARLYLGLSGGIAVPEVLGSRSTCLAAAFGGLDGRPLRAGDVVAGSIGEERSPDDEAAGERAWPLDPLGATSAPAVLRVLPGPAPGLEPLVGRAWRVGREADRVGLRLDGGPLPEGIGGEAVSHGVVWGAIQVPPDGRPIVLGPDHQTTGGYPVIAIVIAADRPILGQLRPGAEVSLQAVGRDEAIEALRAQEAALAAGTRALRDAAGWDELVRSAGG